MTSCKLALFVLFFIATSLFPAPAYSWDLLGTTTPTSGNAYPGSRSGAANWVSNGTVWMFSGLGTEATSAEGYLTSLYKYNLTTSKWSLAAGPTTTNQAAIFPSAIGGKGFPGGRYGASQWTDSAGNLWLFGGNGNGNDSSTVGLLNDLWKYNPILNQWSFFGGNQAAGAASTDSARPTPRQGAACWTDATGNLWLFGGQGMALGATKASMLIDMWYWSPTQSTWSTYFSDSTPSARYSSASWTDQAGNGWIYGGRDSSSNYLSDLWQFNVADLTWLLKSGTPNVNQNPTYPTLLPGTGTPGGLYSASALVNNGGIYLFGGYGLDKSGAAGSTRDLWRFNTTSLTWTFLAGTPGTRTGSTTTPGARSSAAAWSVSGYIYLFGGSGYDTNGTANTGDLGDFWRSQFCGFDNTCVAGSPNNAATPTTLAATLTSGATSGSTGFVTSTGPRANTTAGSTATSGGQGVTSGGAAGTTGGATTGVAEETTTTATVTINMGMTGDPSQVNTDAIGDTVASSLGVPAEFINITIVYDNGTKRAVNIPFHLVITVFFPNSSAIAAVTGGAATPNITAQLATLQSVVTNAANSTSVRNTLASSGVTVTSVTSTTTSQVVTTPSSTTLPNWPQTTKSGYSAGFALTPSVFTSTLIVLAASLLALL